MGGLLNTFVRKAVKGCPCTYIREGSAERMGAQYSVDRNLEHLMVKAMQDTGPVVTFPLACIEDLCCLSDAEETYFPAEIRLVLQPKEIDLLVMITYGYEPKRHSRLCLLEVSRYSRDVLMECLRILCICARQ